MNEEIMEHNDEDDDELINEIDVYLSNSLANKIYVLQVKLKNFVFFSFSSFFFVGIKKKQKNLTKFLNKSIQLDRPIELMTIPNTLVHE